MKLTHLAALALMLIFSSAVVAQAPTKKKNSRPQRAEPSLESEKKAGVPVFFYEFAKPEFHINKIRIAHDEAGLGTISFTRKDFEESIEQSLELSEATTSYLVNLWTELRFMQSSEDYQSKLDYSHLGTIKLGMKREGKSRTSVFNWTDNKKARALAAEYRKIGYELIWVFDIGVARRNQPLESPRIMKRLEGYLRLDNISDPPHMIPLLLELYDDERMPLIARNHAKRLADKIKKKHRKK